MHAYLSVEFETRLVSLKIKQNWGGGEKTHDDIRNVL